ncbi:MAG: hypothetical protein JO152_13860, partial [Mycobacteriaceae bacterium]|nr:hypothetical protein [Mycobacteriaceae bacterium]
ELSAHQRHLVDELARAACDAAGIAGPSAALRDDVTATLQAAVADADVTARLGRLTKAEQWTGFGAFGDAEPVSTPGRGGAPKPAPTQSPPQQDEGDEARDEARAVLAAARLRRDDARRRLQQAERELERAQNDYDEAKRADRAAADAVKHAEAQLK